MSEQQQRLREIESALTRVYLKIFKEIKKNPNYPNNIGMLQYKFNRLVYDNTRAAVQQSVIIGIERINKQLKMQSYLTRKDIEVIEYNTNQQVASFWRKVQIAIKEEQQPLIGGGITDYFGATAIGAVFTSLADSVKSKVGQLVDVIKGTEKPKLRWETASDAKVCPVCQGFRGREFDYDDPFIPRPGPEPDGSSHYNCRCELVLVD